MTYARRSLNKHAVKKQSRQRKPARLPEWLRPFFWSYDFGKLSWEKHAELVTYQILTAGDEKAMAWLRKRLGDDALRQWIVRREGKGLSNRRLRYWEIELNLPHEHVNAWLANPVRLLWENRLHQKRSSG